MKIYLTIIVIHWIADFICQDEKWANRKSTSIKYLLKHTLTYSLIWFFPFIWFIINIKFGEFDERNSEINLVFIQTLKFVAVTFIYHTLTDFFTSKIVSRKFTKKEYGSSIPNFGAFTIIGFDQVLHYFQLFISYDLIFN